MIKEEGVKEMVGGIRQRRERGGESEKGKRKKERKKKEKRKKIETHND